MGIFDLVTSLAIQTYWEEINDQREPYWAESKFPNAKQMDDELKWIKGRNEVPVVLRPSAYDVQVLPRLRNEISAIAMKMPFFKESYYIDEELRKQLIRLQAGADSQYAEFVLLRVFNDIAKLITAAAAQRERMRMSLLTTGTIAFNSNGQAIELDYGLDAGQFQNAANPWSDTTNATPLADIQAALDYIQENSDVEGTEMLLNRVTLRYLMQNDEIMKGIYAVNAFAQATNIVNQASVQQYLSTNYGINIIVYNKQYRDEQEVQHKYMPDNLVVFMPSGTLGQTVFCPTPEETDLLGRVAQDVSIVDTGVAITTMVKQDPVNVETKVSMSCLPSFPGASGIVILDVA